MMKIALALAVICIFIVIGGSAIKQYVESSYHIGYEKGSWHTALYIRATNVLPSGAWRERNQAKEFQTEEDILKSLTPAEREQADWYKTHNEGFILKR